MASFINGPIATNFGIHTKKTQENYEISQRGGYGNLGKVKMGFLPEMKPSTASNLQRIAGWIPVIGIITGAYRLYTIFKSNNNVDIGAGNHGFAQIGRAVAEILCLGPVLMIADIAFTALRLTVCAPKTEGETPPSSSRRLAHQE